MSTPVAPIARSLLTGALVSYLTGQLAGESILVGRGSAPLAGGWVGGQPGTSEYQPYVAVKTGRANLLEADPLGRNRMSWRCNYQLTSAGGSEAHADDVADWVRTAVVSLPTSFTLRGVEWVLQKVDLSELGNTVSSSAVDPPFWNVTDAVSLWLSRSRAS